MDGQIKSGGQFKAYLALIFAVLCWSGIWIAGRGVHEEIRPVAMSFWRWLLAALIFLPFVFGQLKREWAIIKRERVRLAIKAAFGVPIFSIFLYWGLDTTGAINGSLLNSAQPVYVMLIAWIIFQQPSRGRELAGVVVSLLGVTAIISRGDVYALARLQFSAGDILVIISAVSWALYTVLLRVWPSELSQRSFMAAIIIFGVPMILPFYIADVALSGVSPVSWPVVISIIYQGVFGSIIAFLCWTYGVTRTGMAVGILFVHLLPVFTAIMAITLLGERLELFHLVGIALILAGIYVATRETAIQPRPPVA